jgi:hypothetical protein
MPTKLRGIIRTVTGGRAVVWMPSGMQDFAVDPSAVAAVMKAVVAQARVAISIRHGAIVGAEPVDATP